MSKRKIFVIGDSDNYANWMSGAIVSSIHEADLVVGIGGADVSPHYYNQPDSGHLSCSPSTDKFEFEYYQKAMKLGKKIIGICKGSQWLCALAGGAIFQDVCHPGRHAIHTFDGQKLWSNSLHHNLADLSKLQDNQYKLLGWADQLSPIHIDGFNCNVPCEKEPEVVYYPKINALGFQNHNEMLYGREAFNDMIDWSRMILNKFMLNQL